MRRVVVREEARELRRVEGAQARELRRGIVRAREAQVRQIHTATQIRVRAQLGAHRATDLTRSVSARSMALG